MRKPLNSILTALTVVFVMMTELSACPNCFSASEESRLAFYLTTIFLTCTPLALVGGTVFFLNRRINSVNDGVES